MEIVGVDIYVFKFYSMRVVVIFKVKVVCVFVYDIL